MNLILPNEILANTYMIYVKGSFYGRNHQRVGTSTLQSQGHLIAEQANSSVRSKYLTATQFVNGLHLINAT